jgi:hypothetical protein
MDVLRSLALNATVRCALFIYETSNALYSTVQKRRRRLLADSPYYLAQFIDPVRMGFDAARGDLFGMLGCGACS